MSLTALFARIAALRDGEKVTAHGPCGCAIVEREGDPCTYDFPTREPHTCFPAQSGMRLPEEPCAARLILDLSLRRKPA